MSDFLPEDELPECWRDEARLNVLFAPFRSRSVNPKDWDSKLEFWKNLTSTYCCHRKRFAFTVSELTKAFTRDGRPPACLGVVVEEMVRGGQAKPVSEFLVKPPDGWGAWASDLFVKKPIVWSFRKIRDSIGGSDATPVTYVHVVAIERSASEICKKHSSELNTRIVDSKELSEVLGMKNDENLGYLLHYLNCQKKVGLRRINCGNREVTLIKFCDGKYCDVSDSDVDIYTLELSEKALVNTIDKLEEESSKLVKEIKNYLLAGRKQLAKTTLRKKHELDRTIEKRANTLHNIQILLSRLKDADTDGHVFETYKKALEGLRKTFKETGLNEDSVADTVFNLEEVMEIQKDIETAMAFQEDVANDRELEEELEDLITEEKPPKDLPKNFGDLEEDFKDLKLVSPPKENPGETMKGCNKSDEDVTKSDVRDEVVGGSEDVDKIDDHNQVSGVHTQG